MPNCYTNFLAGKAPKKIKNFVYVCSFNWDITNSIKEIRTQGGKLWHSRAVLKVTSENNTHKQDLPFTFLL